MFGYIVIGLFPELLYSFHFLHIKAPQSYAQFLLIARLMEIVKRHKPCTPTISLYS